MNNEADYLKHYKVLIQEKLNWGDCAEWRHQDFETLSEKIFTNTGVMLSSTTLKRILGKLKYTSVPNTNTLNALALFLGHESWLVFKSKVDQQETERRTQQENEAKSYSFEIKKIKEWWRWALLGLVLIVGISLFFNVALHEEKPIFTDKELASTQFSSKPLARGIPNTVVFQYDVSDLEIEKLEIQQSWDELLRFEVDENKNEATSTYFYPGYFRAKLLIDGQVAKEHDLYIKSNAWIAALHRDPKPRYFLASELTKNGVLSIQNSAIQLAQPHDKAPYTLGFHYIDDFGALDSDDFTLEASFRNTYYEGNDICQLTKIIIIGTEGAFIIPFSIPGCVGNLRVMLNDLLLNGKEQNLSAFGCDFTQWQSMKFNVQNKTVRISLNDSIISTATYHKNAGRVVGFRFLFSGNGEIDHIRLKNKQGELVYEELF